MKILVVCQYYKPEPFRISDICESLAQQGHEILVVTGMPNYPEGELYKGYEDGKSRDETINGVRVHRCAIHPRHHGALHRFWNYYSFVFASKRYLLNLREEFDVVFVNQLSPVMMAEGAVAYAKKHRKKLVLYCLDLWPESLLLGGIRRGSLVYRLFWHISRRIYRQADKILVTSRSFIEYFSDILKLPTKNIQYLPQYAESRFSEIEPVQRHDPPYTFLFAGNVGKAISVQTIVEAARLLQSDKRIHITIVGDGTELSHCMELADGLDNITFLGRRKMQEMPELYKSADAMLVTLKDLPSLDVTLPGKVQSYMTAGRGVVGAINGETPIVVRNAQCGVCVSAEDASALADAMQRVVNEPNLFVEYGRKARDYYRNYFDKQHFMTALIETFAFGER